MVRMRINKKRSCSRTKKEDAVVQPPKVKSVVKQKLRKVLRKRKDQQKEKKREGSG